MFFILMLFLQQTFATSNTHLLDTSSTFIETNFIYSKSVRRQQSSCRSLRARGPRQLRHVRDVAAITAVRLLLRVHRPARPWRFRPFPRARAA